MPAHTTESDAMSKALAKLGFKFVGSTICYAFMQATGMVNDHLVECCRYDDVVNLGKRDACPRPRADGCFFSHFLCSSPTLDAFSCPVCCSPDFDLFPVTFWYNPRLTVAAVTKVLIDNVLLAKISQLLIVLGGAMTLATALGYGVGALNRYYYTQVTARVLFALRQHLFAHLQTLSLRFHARAQVGDLLSRLNTDISEVQSILTDTVFALLSNLLVLVVSIGFLLWLDWRLFLLSLVSVPLQLYGVMRVRPRMVEETRRVRELNAAIASFLVESLSSVKFIKLFTVEQLQLRRLGVLGERFVQVVTRFEMVGYVAGSVSTATTF